MALASALASLDAVLAASGDSDAAQFELLHEIETLLRLVPPDEVKASQSALEKALTTALLLVWMGTASALGAAASRRQWRQAEWLGCAITVCSA